MKEKQRTISVRSLCEAAVFLVLVYIATGVLPHIPVGVGYLHAGDVFIYLAASVLPPVLAVPCAALGAGLADLTAGFAVYIPATVIIKSATALLFSCKEKRIVCRRNIIAAALAALPCVAGYALWELIIYGSAAAPLLSVAGNLAQSVFSGLLYAALGAAADRAGFLKR